MTLDERIEQLEQMAAAGVKVLSGTNVDASQAARLMNAVARIHRTIEQLKSKRPS
jgi:hypothetical protein